MNISTEIAVAVVMKLESDGYLKAGTRWKDETLLPAVTEIIDARLKDTRQEFARFCLWWAEIAHKGHPLRDTTSPFEPQDFWHCLQPICLSLVGTINDLANDLKTTPSAIAESASGHAPPPLS